MALWINRDGKPMLSAALSATASELERYTAKELRDHVEKVTGAVLTLSTGTESGPSVWIGTPDSIPKLKDLSNSGVRPLPLGMGMKAAAKCVQHRFAMRLEM